MKRTRRTGKIFKIKCYFRIQDSGYIPATSNISNVDKMNMCHVQVSDTMLRGTKASTSLVIHKKTDSSYKKIGDKEFKNAVKKVFYESHDRVDLRLGMYLTITECSKNPYICPMVHKYSNYGPCSSTLNIFFESLLNKDFWMDSFLFMNFLLLSDLYPSPAVTLKFLVLICQTNDFKLIGNVHDVFNALIKKHPPCAPRMRKYYFDVFTSSLENIGKSIFKNGIGLKKGIFTYVIAELDLTLNNIVNDKSHSDESEDVESDSDSSMVGQGSENVPWATRQEYLKRLCLILTLIVNVLEADLAVWIVNKGNIPKQALFKNTKRPLIATLLWQENKSHGNYFLSFHEHYEPLVRMFVTSVHNNLSPAVTKVLCRLLALVGELMKIGDFESKAAYPHFGDHCKVFTHAINQTIDRLPASSIVSVLEEMLPLWLVMLVANLRLSRFCYRFLPTNSLKIVISCLKALIHSNSSSAYTYTFEHHGRNTKNHFGETEMHIACQKNNLESLTELLLDPDVNVNAVDHAFWTPLHEAVAHNNYECVLKILESRPPFKEDGVNVKVKNYKGQTPLMDAVQIGNAEICKLLVMYGGKALLEDYNNDGKTAKDLATSEDIIKVLEETAPLKETRLSLLFTYPLSHEVWDILNIYSKAFLNTFEVKNLKNTLESLPLVPENRTKKVELSFDFVQARRELMYFLKIRCLLNESKTLKVNKKKLGNLYCLFLK